MAPKVFLSISEYDIAVKNLDKFANNQDLKLAKPIKSRGITQIYGITGGFSRVYKISLAQKSKALRCWFKDPGNVQNRYPIISKYLSEHPLEYFVDFRYVPDAIRYRGSISVSWMDWVEGQTLSKFIDLNINSPKNLIEISEEFLRMTKELHKLKIAHGDLQSENIMVCQNGKHTELKLIDYDSLYVPTLPDSTLDDLPGVSSFQHPKRPKIMKEKADYFSELVIYLSLLVYAADPIYWNGLSQNDKRLLFEDKDFLNPNSSKIIAGLLKSSNSQINYLTEQLINSCKLSPSKLKPLENVLLKPSSNISGGISGDFTEFFDEYQTQKPMQKRQTKKQQPFDEFFAASPTQTQKKGVSVTYSQTCPQGHQSTNPAEIFCAACNDISSFFGPGRLCPSCGKGIPDRKEIHYCPYCRQKI